jgi:hypothetical protein
MTQKRKGLVFGMMGLALALCLTLAACPGDPDDSDKGDNLVIIAGKDMTELAPFPVHGASRPETIAGQPEFTGTIAWEASFDNGASFDAAPGSTFVSGTLYRAVVTLQPKSGYTFNGTAENSFTHQKGAATNPRGGGGGGGLIF